ncbi:hypothetical protein [Novosphingobium sp.]|uniref:hypothetical protein n=1 Tax=Novosphingobium sp. TaxID=1874826 RepID=UPI0026083056|nr:hypothetical protein [Novosphingobium sp.]
MRRKIAFFLPFALVVPTAMPTYAQAPVRIDVGPITAAQQCKVYQGVIAQSSGYVAGSSAGYAGAFGAGGASSIAAGWQSSLMTYFVKDCVNQFAGVRMAMQAALASSNAVVVAPGGFVLRGRVENVAPVGSAYREATNHGSDYGMSSGGLVVTMSFTVSDRSGRIVYGDLVKSTLETDFSADAHGSGFASTMSEDGQYAQLQRLMALDAARKVALHFRPMRVVNVDGKSISVNYGSPFLESGMILNVTSPNGANATKFGVSSTGDGTSIAQSLSGGAQAGIAPGDRVTVADVSEPVMDRVELP